MFMKEFKVYCINRLSVKDGSLFLSFCFLPRKPQAKIKVL